MKFQPHQSLPLRTLLVVALSSAFAPQALAAAGTAQFTAGDVQLKRADGGLAPLAKGKIIDSGQAIVTGVDGRAQVRFTDGGLISLQPNTEFKIASYVDKLDAKEDRFLVDLLRGSMRAITGLIGKRNRDNYKVNTATATIGIRGSGFNVGYNPDGTLSVTTELDAIEVCTAGGCIGLTAGESVKVLNNSQAPVRTNVRATVPTPPPAQEAQLATQQAGLLAQIKARVPVPMPVVIEDLPPVPPTPPVGPLPDVSINSASVLTLVTGLPDFPPFLVAESLISAPGGGVGAIVSGTGQLLRIDVPQQSGNFRYTSLNPATDVYGKYGAPTDANFIGWGRWATVVQTDTNPNGLAPTNFSDFAYVTGRPTLGSATAPTAGVGTYEDVGGTSAVFRDSNSNIRVEGTFNGAALSINFTSTVVTAKVSTSLGSFENILGSMNPTNRTFTGNGNSNSTPYYSGFLIGPNGDRAGLTYSIPYTYIPPVGATIYTGFTTGTVGLRRANLTP